MWAAAGGVEVWRTRQIDTPSPPLPCDIPRVNGNPDLSAGLRPVGKLVVIYAGVGLTVNTVFGMTNFERGLDFVPALLCATLAVFAAWPRIMKPRTAG